jgi:hypothetical protein
MDQDRQIRFLIPPFFLYASVLWWAFLDPHLHCWLVATAGGGTKEILPLAAAVGGLTIPVGYSIGTLAMFLNWLGFLLFKPGQTFEAYASDVCFRDILRLTRSGGYPADQRRPNLLYAVATFDHELLPEKTHKWIERRWISFNVAFGSAIAIIISFAIVLVRSIRTWPFNPSCGATEQQWLEAAAWSCAKWWWLGINVGLLILLFWAARKAWRETMGMIEFQSRRKNVYELTKRKKPD